MHLIGLTAAHLTDDRFSWNISHCHADLQFLFVDTSEKDSVEHIRYTQCIIEPLLWIFIYSNLSNKQPSFRVSFHSPWDWLLSLEYETLGGWGGKGECVIFFFSLSSSKNSQASWLHRPAFPGQQCSFTASEPHGGAGWWRGCGSGCETLLSSSEPALAMNSLTFNADFLRNPTVLCIKANNMTIQWNKLW